jgi:Flp pilus assembly protein TadD
MFSLFGNDTKEGAAQALREVGFATAIKRYRKALEKSAADHEMHHDLGIALLESGARISINGRLFYEGAQARGMT